MKRLLLLLTAFMLLSTSCEKATETGPFDVTGVITEKEFVPEHDDYGMHYGYHMGEYKMHNGHHTIDDNWSTKYTFLNETRSVSGVEEYDRLPDVGEEITVTYMKRFRMKKDVNTFIGNRIVDISIN
jgi:hypothetical protein